MHVTVIIWNPFTITYKYYYTKPSLHFSFFTKKLIQIWHVTVADRGFLGQRASYYLANSLQKLKQIGPRWRGRTFPVPPHHPPKYTTSSTSILKSWTQHFSIFPPEKNHCWAQSRLPAFCFQDNPLQLLICRK